MLRELNKSIMFQLLYLRKNMDFQFLSALIFIMLEALIKLKLCIHDDMNLTVTFQCYFYVCTLAKKFRYLLTFQMQLLFTSASVSNYFYVS